MRRSGIAAALAAGAVAVVVTAPAASAAAKAAPHVQPGTARTAAGHLHPLALPAVTPASVRAGAPKAKPQVPIFHPDLNIAKSHDGVFHRGQHNAVYTITVANYGDGYTIPFAALTVHDTLPAGLTATAINGAGWHCTLSTLTCVRLGPLGPNTQYPPIYLLVNVADNAPGLVTNAATLSSSDRRDLPRPITVLDPTKIMNGEGPNGRPTPVNVTIINQNNNNNHNANHNSANAKAKAKADVKVKQTTAIVKVNIKHTTHITKIVRPARHHCRPRG